MPAEENSVQFNGSGTFNGASASFRVCVQDNHQGNKGAEAALVAVEMANLLRQIKGNQ